MMGHSVRSGPRSTPPPSTRCRAGPTASSTSTVCVVEVDDGAYVSRAAASQESNALAATAVANGLVLLPDGEGVDAGDTVRVMLLDRNTDRGETMGDDHNEVKVERDLVVTCPTASS